MWESCQLRRHLCEIMHELAIRRLIVILNRPGVSGCVRVPCVHDVLQKAMDLSLADARAASVCLVRADFFWFNLELVHEAVIFEDLEDLVYDGNEPRLVILELLALLHDDHVVFRASHLRISLRYR